MLNKLRQLLSPQQPVAETPEDGVLPGPEDADLPQESADAPASRRKERPAWLGLALDGTLAEAPERPPEEPYAPDAPIGEPVYNMAQRLRDWHAEGLTVKIFTWRAGTKAGRQQVRDWLKQHGLPRLEVTDKKDFDMVEFWSAEAVQVPRNTGQVVGSSRLPDDDEA
jgi:hypothetical protein